IYDQIVSSRRDPALVEKIGRNRFRLSVFPVLPRVRTIVELTWIEQVPLSQGVYRYVYPLALAGTGERVRRDFSFSLTADSTIPITQITSPAKDMSLKVAADGRSATAGLVRRGGRLDRDIVVSTAVTVAEPTLTVRTYRGGKGHGFFTAILTPPPVKPEDLVARDVVLLLDTSGSMRGEKLQLAQAAARLLIAGLREVDRVNVVAFGTSLEPFADGPVPVTEENRKKVEAFLAGLAAGGTTGLGDAMKLAGDVEAPAGRVRTVILLTDGHPTTGETEASRIVELARQGGKKGLRFFCFGVGDDVNPPLLDGIASAGSGGSEILPTAEDVSVRLARFLDRTAAPVLSDIRFEIEGAKTYDVFPRPIPSAGLGRQIVIAGRYREGGKHGVTVRATLGNQAIALTRQVEFATEAAGRRSVVHVFAARKLAYLEGEMRARSGLSDLAFFEAVDRGDSDETDEIIEEMIRTSLTCGVQCVYTSFLVLLPEDRWRIDPEDEEALAKAKQRADDAKKDAVANENGGPAESGEPVPMPGTGEEGAPAVPPPPNESVPDIPDAPDIPNEDPPPPERSEDPPPPDEGEGNEEPPPSDPPPPAEDEGGPHRGPAGDVPPDERHPNSPPPEDGGAPAGGGEGSGDGGGDSEPAPPAAPTPPPAAAAGGAIGKAEGPGGPGGRKARTGAVRDSAWVLWWRSNADGILAAAADRGVHRTHPPASPATIETLRRIVTNAAATTALRGEAALALGRIGGATEHGILVEAVRNGAPGLAVPAALGLGVAATPAPGIRTALLETIRDQVRDVRVRIAAILALGLMRDESPAVILELFSRLDGTEPDDQVPAAALFSLGLIGDEGFVPRLSEWLKTGRIGRRRIETREAMAIVDALGRIGHGRAAALLAQTLRGTDIEVRRSAAIALGRVLPRLPEAEQVRQVRFLLRYRSDMKDAWTRNYLTVSLGRIAASEETYPRVRKAIVAVFSKELSTVRRLAGAEFVALALGLATPSCELGEREEIRAVLRHAAGRLRGKDAARGYMLVGVALAGDRSTETGDLLLSTLRRRRSRVTRMGAATAIGLLELRAGEPELRRLLRTPEGPELTATAAAAAGLIGDPASRDALILRLTAKSTGTGERRAVATALGRMGHANAAPALRGVLSSGPTDRARAGAALALGLLHARAGTIPLHRLSEDLHHPALGPAIRYVMDWK
ncbi:MAG: HEAT repeat domain-containing protein, partial [Planctomycetota bacterium]